MTCSVSVVWPVDGVETCSSHGGLAKFLNVVVTPVSFVADGVSAGGVSSKVVDPV